MQVHVIPSVYLSKLGFDDTWFKLCLLLCRFFSVFQFEIQKWVSFHENKCRPDVVNPSANSSRDTIRAVTNTFSAIRVHIGFKILAYLSQSIMQILF